ncbi:hypothetical protein ACQ2HG_10865 [Aeromonas hydrophila]|uniref:hypothetical protein n=1 Tax=Aeromonas hydrophila TaxID=644 RepID=UPI001F52B660|nr:hypothetical protein [Aeromonas hydrophila]UUT59256.1 hypothetical protein MOO40_19230 [Aeromonas hydrophila]
MSFWESILASIAKKFDSILNRPFENKFTWSLFALGSMLITGSSVYGFVTKGKAELKSQDYNFVLEFVSGPEIIPTLIGTILVGFSIAIFWKTKISSKPANDKSDFDKIVESGIEKHPDYIIEKAFKKEFKYLTKVSTIKFILTMSDSYSKFLDYKKALSHLIIENGRFLFKHPKRLNLISGLAVTIYFLFAFITLGSIQLVILAIKAENLLGVSVFSILVFSMAAITVTSLNTYGETAAARRLVQNA